MPDLYAAADLFIAPSIVADSGDTEGQGVVLLEAFAAHVPVIATNVGGIGEIVRHNETGWLVAPRWPDLLAGAIEHLLSDRKLALRLRQNAFRVLKERYDWSEIAHRFEALYRELTGSRD